MIKVAYKANSFEEAERLEKEYYRRLTPLERLAIMLELNSRWSESPHAETTPDFKEFIALLNSNEARHLIVGGYAVAYHGYPRFTGDIDIFVETSDENTRKIEAAPNAFGFSGLRLHAADFQQPEIIVQLGYPPNRIDLLTSISGVAFADAWKGRETVEIEDMTLLS